MDERSKRKKEHGWTISSFVMSVLTNTAPPVTTAAKRSGLTMQCRTMIPHYAKPVTMITITAANAATELSMITTSTGEAIILTAIVLGLTVTLCI